MIYYRVNALPFLPSIGSNIRNNINLVDENNNIYKFSGRGELTGIISTAGVLKFENNTCCENRNLILAYNSYNISLGKVDIGEFTSIIEAEK